MSEKIFYEDFTFLLGAVRYKDLLYFAIQSDLSDPSYDPHCYPLTLDHGQWGGNIKFEWIPVGMTIAKAPLQQMIMISEDGNVFALGSGKEGFETIEFNGISPQERGGPLRNVRAIGNSVYAVGMKRQVYKRMQSDSWNAIDGGTFSETTDVVGFESIDGFNEEEIYAVGWEGEIWRYDDSEWSKVSSPTNLILMDVCCGKDGNVYVAGQLGLLIVGKDDMWSVIDTDLNENIWSLAWFDGSLYLATYSGIYKLVDDSVQRINFTDDIPGTFYGLSEADGLLCSIGGKDVMGFDGKHWFRIY